MKSSLAYTALSAASLVAVIAFCAWTSVALPGSPSALILLAVMTLVAVALLRVGAGRPVTYWVPTGPKGQAARVGWMILVSAALHFALGLLLTRSDLLTPITIQAIYLGVGIGVPLLFFAFCGVRAPRRLARPRSGDLLIVATFAILFAAGNCLLQMPKTPAPSVNPQLTEVLIGGGVVMLGAAMEEVVFRLLFLTALLQASGSRFQAVILSSVAFALVHVPSAIAYPLALQDGEMLRLYAMDFFPSLAGIIGMGFVLGALWLRTGSIMLLIVFHTILNLAPVLVAGLGGL